MDDVRPVRAGLTLIASPAGICGLRFPGGSPGSDARPRTGGCRTRNGSLASYFAGERQDFELELDLRGAPLQRLVWSSGCGFPHGETTTWGELAQRINVSLYPAGPISSPYKRARLVGAAIGRTPTPILVPCHRVIGPTVPYRGYGVRAAATVRWWIWSAEGVGVSA